MNLWADLDNNNHLSADSSVHGRARHTRRLTEHLVLSSLRDWLLRDYAAAYCRSLDATRIFRRCYWVDALGIAAREQAVLPPPATPESVATTRASKGRKKNGQPAILPPALQPIGSLSQALAQEGLSITLHGLMLEAGSSKRKEPRAYQNGQVDMAKAMVVPKEGGIVRASWLEAGPLLLNEIAQSPAIFLLNPFGPTAFTYEDLAPLYQRTVPTELCLLIPHRQIAQRLLAAQRSPGQAVPVTSLLRSDRWKALPTGEAERGQAIDGFIDLLTASMKRHFLLPPQCIALPMQARTAVVEHVPYTLIFATRRQDSLFSMNDAVCCYRRRVYEQSHRGLLAEEWFAAQQRERHEDELRRLSARLLHLGRERRVRRWPDLRQTVLLANFGQFTVRDYDAILQQLLRNGEVRCEWRRRPAEEEENRLPSNDDILLWT